jgi:hypothetical protein
MTIRVFELDGAAVHETIKDPGIVITVTRAGAEAPGITGPGIMMLQEGYDMASTGVFTVTGKMPSMVAIDNNYGGHITWNDSMKKLDVAAGLLHGEYPIVLTASDGINPDMAFEFTLIVTPAVLELERIEIASLPIKTMYIVGERLDITGLAINAIYKGGSLKEVTDFSLNPMNYMPLFTPGIQTVTVSYIENYIKKTLSFTVTVEEPEFDFDLVGIEVSSLPIKTKYSVGEMLDLEGLSVRATYSDGSSKDVTGFSIYPSGLYNIGLQSITIMYNEGNVSRYTSFEVTVDRGELDLLSIEIISLPTKTEYIVGETLDLGGLAIRATYNDGNSKEVTGYYTYPYNGWAFTPYDDDTVFVAYKEGFITENAMFEISLQKTTVVPTIIGPETLKIIEGYSTASPGIYFVSGEGHVTVSISDTYGDKIAWDDSGMRLLINEGLPIGDYPIVLTASNGIGPDATLNFLLTVVASYNWWSDGWIYAPTIDCGFNTDIIEVKAGDLIEFTLSVENTVDLLLLSFEIESDRNMLEIEDLLTFNGFECISFDCTDLDGGKVLFTVELAYPCKGDDTGFTGADPAVLAKFIFRALATGKTSVELKKLEAKLK